MHDAPIPKKPRTRKKAKAPEAPELISGDAQVRGLAHDLNNLLTGIFGYLHLAHTTLDKDHPAAIHLDNARRLLGLTRELTARMLATTRAVPPGEKAPPVKTTRESPDPAACADRILVMDDEEYVLDISSAFLEALGFSPVKARHGDEAVELFRQALHEKRPFKAVILDLTIRGGMGGAATLKLLREADPGVRAVATSGYSNDPILSDFQAYGFAAALRKPYLHTELSAALEKALHAPAGKPLP